MKTKTLLFLAAFFLIAFNFLKAQQLDNTFGYGGIVNTAVGLISDECNSVVRQTDGKIIAAGGTIITNNVDSSHNAMAAVRYNTDGTIDTFFGTDGKITIMIDSSSEAQSVLLQNDGKIILAGYSIAGDLYKFALARFNSDGSLDNSFGTDGKVTTEIGSTAVAFTACIQTDGKIILAGKTWNGMNYDFALARYISSGVLDDSFGAGGIVTTAFGSDDEIYAMLLQNDEKIVVTGISGDSYNFNFALARYNYNGSLDSSFGTNGKVISDLGTQFDIPKAILFQNDGKIIVTGNVYGGGYNYFAVVRYNSGGTLDSSFGSDGLSVSYSFNLDCISAGSALQSDGKIILAGTSNWFTSDADFCLQRFNSNGDIDTTFGDQGIFISDLSSSFDFCNSALMQSDGKMVLIGISYGEGEVPAFTLARYTIGTTDIDEEDYTDIFSIFPNPSNGKFHFTSRVSNVKISIYNVLGEKVFEASRLEHGISKEIDLSEFRKGIYLSDINYHGKIYTKKIVIQ